MLFLSAALAGCATPDVSDAGPTVAPAIGHTATLTVAAPVGQPTAEMSNVGSTAVPTATPPPLPTSVGTSTPAAQRTRSANRSTATPTATPQPTFTPPPPPSAVEGQQLWLARPLSSGSVWTDKAYPYGSTRGGTLRPHTGVEFGAPVGTPVRAAAGGTVIVAGDDSVTAYGPQSDFYGNLVIIESATGGAPLYTLYGHLSAVQVAVGQTVAAGDVIGLSGASGIADGPHLHFEVRLGENAYSATRNPLLWLVPLPQTGVVAGRVVGPGDELLHEVLVSLTRVDAPASYTATTTYAEGEPNTDSVMGENFVLDDVVPGFYEVVVGVGDRHFTTELWVYPGRVNWVEIVAAP